MKYITLFTFDILEAIKKGHEVFMLDRADGRVYKVTEWEVGQFFRTIDVAEQDRTNRYSFWREEIEHGHDTF